MMKPQDLRARLQGVISFPVTPFAQDLSLDLDGLRKNLAHNARFPFCAVVAAGGTGELYSLDVDEHRQVVAATVAAFAGKAPVIAGVGGSLAVARTMAREAAAAGADGILALPPLYADPPDEGLVAYYRAIADATPLGMLIYSRDWFKPGPAMVAKLAEAIPTLVAWKDGQADLRRYQLIRQAVGDRLAWIGGAGDDMVPGYYAIGIRTYTSSIATISPALALALDKAAAAGDSTTLLGLMERYVTPLYALRARKRGYEVTAMKAAMDVVGFAGGAVRPPLPTLPTSEREELAAMMAGWSAYL
ncbi:MAG TPA: dihydrodipicolinate synthase family protein [Polyangia bacterium]